MIQATRLNILPFIFLVSVMVTEAEAIQVPVNGGPVNQAVPQYRPRYPISSQNQASQSNQITPRPQILGAEKINRAAPAATDARPNAGPRGTQRPSAENVTAPHSTRYPLSSPANQSTEALPAPPRTPSIPKPVPKQSTEELKQAAAKKTAEKKKKKTSPPLISHEIYRDRNPLPIDPRKPCGICTNPASQCGCGPLCDAPGLHGKPFQEREPGACRCGDKKCSKCKPMFSIYWPRPFSAKLDEHFPDQAAARYSPCQKKRVVDVFDKLADFKLIDYQRRDNGYCGEDSDPYGCLGESRMIQSGVAGVGYRFPSVPVDRSAAKESRWH